MKKLPKNWREQSMIKTLQHFSLFNHHIMTWETLKARAVCYLLYYYLLAQCITTATILSTLFLFLLKCTHFYRLCVKVHYSELWNEWYTWYEMTNIANIAFLIKRGKLLPWESRKLLSQFALLESHHLSALANWHLNNWRAYLKQLRTHPYL